MSDDRPSGPHDALSVRSIATHAEIDAEGNCHAARTCWIPSAEVELVAPAKILNVELRMDALAELADGPAAQKALGPFVKQYRDWIADQKKVLPSLNLQSPRDG